MSSTSPDSAGRSAFAFGLLRAVSRPRSSAVRVIGEAVIGYPLLLRPVYDEKIWGGRRLEQVLGKALPAGVLVGESLESGNEAVVVNGDCAGSTLLDLVRREGQALLGERGLAASRPFGDFPLLVKFIDAADILSLQVHPDDLNAPEGRRGKTEAWHVLAVEGGASLITGMSGTSGPDAVRRAIEDELLGELVEERLVQPGDTLLIRAGTIHAIGAGVLLYEVQQNSDITYRLYDWARVDGAGRARELHLEQGLRVMRGELRAASLEPLNLEPGREVLAACRYFALERWRVDGRRTLPPSPGSFRLLSVLDGEPALVDRGRLTLARGQTVLLPADLPGACLSGSATLLVTYIPDLERDIVEPLLGAGYSPEAVARLDGGTGDVARLLPAAG